MATAARYALGGISPDIIPFATYFPAVLFAALVGGAGAGVLALALSTAAGWYLFLQPAFAFFPIGPTHIANILLFVGATAVLVWGVALYRSSQRRLELSLSELKAVTDTAVDAIITIDTKGVIQSANPATKKLFGHEPAELVGQNIGELMPQPYSAEHGSFLRNYLDTGVRKVIGIGREVSGRRADGSTFPMHLSVSEFVLDGRRYFTGFVRDLSELKRSEAAFLQLGRVIEESLDEIYVCHAETLRFLSANRGARVNLGYSDEELSRLTPLDITTEFSRESYDALIAPLKSGAQERVSFTTQHRRKDGSSYPVEVHLQFSRAADPPMLVAHARDLTEQKRQEDNVNLLVRELTHRSKNLLAVVQALVHQTIQSSGSFADFQSRFFARLKALAASQDLLVRGSWRGAHADELVRSQLAHFGEALGKQIELSGPSLFLSSEAVQALGLALHELSTNAIKYGALSVPWGKVRIAWEHAPGAGNGEFRISWRESGGPRVGEPSRSGFGRSVVERNLSLALAAKVQLEFKPEGLSWEAKLPGSHLIDASPSARPRESRDPALDTRSPLSRGQAARE